MNDGVNVELRGAVMIVTIDRPPVNAINVTVSRELGRVFREFEDNDDLIVAIITGAGDRIFSAGWDMKEAEETGLGERDDYGVGGFGGLTEAFFLTKPVIAAVNGVAIGGGFEIILSCDLVVASKDASFILPETSLGVVADAGGVQRLPRKIPRNLAMELLLTGHRLTVERAFALGLVNTVVASGCAVAEAAELAERIACNSSLAIRAAKEIVCETEGLALPDAYEILKGPKLNCYNELLSSGDRKEGPKAFLEKRKPVWKK